MVRPSSVPDLIGDTTWSTFFPAAIQFPKRILFSRASPADTKQHQFSDFTDPKPGDIIRTLFFFSSSIRITRTPLFLYDPFVEPLQNHPPLPPTSTPYTTTFAYVAKRRKPIDERSAPLDRKALCPKLLFRASMQANEHDFFLVWCRFSTHLRNITSDLHGSGWLVTVGDQCVRRRPQQVPGCILHFQNSFWLLC